MSPFLRPYLRTRAVERCVVWVLTLAQETRSWVWAFMNPASWLGGCLESGEAGELKSHVQVVMLVGTRYIRIAYNTPS